MHNQWPDVGINKRKVFENLHHLLMHLFPIDLYKKRILNHDVENIGLDKQKKISVKMFSYPSVLTYGCSKEPSH